MVVVNPEDEGLDGNTMEAAYTGDGTMVNSGDFNGMGNREAMEAIATLMTEKRHRPEDRQLPAQGLGYLEAALLGCTHSHDTLRQLRHRSRTRK